MNNHPRQSVALGAIATLLVEHEAKVGLNEIWDILQALDSAAYEDGFRDGQENANGKANEASERDYHSPFGGSNHEEGGP